MAVCTIAFHEIWSLPNLNLKFQFVTELLPDSLADPVDQLEDVRGFRAGVGDDVIRMTVGHFSSSETRSLQSGLIDECARRDVRRGIPEDAAGELVSVRLIFFLDDPDPPHASHDRFGILGRKFKLCGQDDGLV
jgi:hypothetical protein